MCHSSAVAVSEGANMEDLVLRGSVDDEENLRRRLPGHTSIAWLLWHIARGEDVAVNVILRNAPTVLAQNGWSERLQITRRDIGTGMTDAEVDDLGATANVLLLRDYRAAVGRATRVWFSDLDLNTLSRPIADAGERAHQAGAFAPAALRLVRSWNGRTGAWFLHWLAIGHNQAHLDAIDHLRSFDQPPSA